MHAAWGPLYLLVLWRSPKYAARGLRVVLATLGALSMAGVTLALHVGMGGSPLVASDWLPPVITWAAGLLIAVYGGQSDAPPLPRSTVELLSSPLADLVSTLSALRSTARTAAPELEELSIHATVGAQLALNRTRCLDEAEWSDEPSVRESISLQALLERILGSLAIEGDRVEFEGADSPGQFMLFVDRRLAARLLTIVLADTLQDLSCRGRLRLRVESTSDTVVLSTRGYEPNSTVPRMPRPQPSAWGQLQRLAQRLGAALDVDAQERCFTIELPGQFAESRELPLPAWPRGIRAPRRRGAPPRAGATPQVAGPPSRVPPRERGEAWALLVALNLLLLTPILAGSYYWEEVKTAVELRLYRESIVGVAQEFVAAVQRGDLTYAVAQTDSNRLRPVVVNGRTLGLRRTVQFRAVPEQYLFRDMFPPERAGVSSVVWRHTDGGAYLVSIHFPGGKDARFLIRRSSGSGAYRIIEIMV